MSLIDSPSDFNKWQVNSGFRYTSSLSVSAYINTKTYTKNLLRDFPLTLKELIVKDINSQKSIVHIDVENVNVMIRGLNNVKTMQKNKFEELRQEDFFSAFRYLHKLIYKR
jgi:hypothetical protein